MTVDLDKIVPLLVGDNLPAGWKDMPSRHQALALQKLKRPFLLRDAKQHAHHSTLNSLFVRGWMLMEDGRLFRSNSGVFALERYRERYGAPA